MRIFFSKKRTLLFLALTVSMILSVAKNSCAITPWLHTSGNRIKDTAGNIVVLRGVDLTDLGATEGWYGGATAMIDRLTDQTDTQGSSPGWYPKVVRLAIYPSDETAFNRSGLDSNLIFTPGNPTNNDAFYNNLLRPVVDYCKNKDLYVIIDWHYVGRNTADKATQTSQFWTYIAPKFANDSNVLFELFNEPLDNASTEANNWAAVKTNMQSWINTVRTSAPNNLILVAGPNYSQAIGTAADSPLTGSNLVMVSHIYPGHLLAANWESYYKSHITHCLTVYPVFMTEWGFRQGASASLLQGTVTNYGQPLMVFREQNRISSTAWIASYDWEPSIFYPGPSPAQWTLRVGEGEMGGFLKDMLYLQRNSNQPADTLIAAVGYSPQWQIITLVSLMLAGGYLVYRRTAETL